jgi:hypothetical protein
MAASSKTATRAAKLQEKPHGHQKLATNHPHECVIFSYPDKKGATIRTAPLLYSFFI